MTLSKSKFHRLVGGRFFTVEFIKRNGDTRRMTARLDVRKYLRGGEGIRKPGLVTVWDCGKQSYRSFYLNSVYSLRANGKIYGGAR